MTATQQQPEAGSTGRENVSGYFKRILLEHPNLLASHNNDELLRRWLADHPGQTTVPDNVKAGLTNAKSALRKKVRERLLPRLDQDRHTAADIEPSISRTAARGFEALEEQIDECMDLARGIDRSGLDDVLKLLRRARNQVVWKMGQ